MTRWAERFLKKALMNVRDQHGTWFVLSGTTGIGKTQMLKRSVRYFSENALAAWLEGFWSGAALPSAWGFDWSWVAAMKPDDFEDWLRTDLRSYSFVAIDDLGAEADRFKSGESSDRLRRVLGALERKWVMISTNYQPAEWRGKLDIRVASRLDAAIVFDGSKIPDYRPKLRNAETN